jgi:flagellar FliL protein
MLAPDIPRSSSARRRSGKALLLVAASVLVLAAAGVVAYLGLGREPEAEGAPPPKPVVVDPGVVEFEPFVLNLADPSGDRYFRLALRLVLDQRAIAEQASAGLGHVKLRDRVLSILARKRASELASAEGKDVLRAELWAATEPLLATEPLHAPASSDAPARLLDVLFTEYLLQ